MNMKTLSLFQLENNQCVVTIDPYGGAITGFHLKKIKINPLSFAFSKEQMPANNKEGAPYKGHFLCLGRWGAPSPGEIRAGLPDHGQFANILWRVEEKKTETVLKMSATAMREGLQVERTIVQDSDNPVYAVTEVVRNINPLGRLFNMVQHPTLAAPFLDSNTIIDCNGSTGFDQALYREINSNIIQWPVATDDQQNKIDLRKSGNHYNAVFSFVIKPGCEYGWITAFSPDNNLLFGYIWKRCDYPWIHLWQHYAAGTILYRGIEFGTAGIHQPFSEILDTSPILFGEKTVAYIDAGESIAKKYLSFIYQTPQGFEGVENIDMVNGKLTINTPKDIDIIINLSSEFIHELSK